MKKPDRRIAELTEKYNQASERDRPRDALAALRELESLDAIDARWSHRLGDALRRLGDLKDAEEAYVRAMERYAAQGFVTKSLAMAKVVESLNPSRAVAHEVDAEPARSLMVKPPIEPLFERAAVLTPAAEPSSEELRFDDGPSTSHIYDLAPLRGDAEPSVIEVTDDDLILIEDDDERSTAEGEAKMAACALFASVSADALRALAGAAELIDLSANQVVVREGQPADAFFAIASGAARVVFPGGGAFPDGIRLREGEIFGESCLLGDARRQATVVADGHLLALRIGKSKLDGIVAAHADVEAALYGLLTRRLLTNTLHASPLFAAFDPPTRLEIARSFEVRRAPVGTVLAEKGKRADGLYIVLAGEMNDDASGQKLGRAATFGHGSLLSRTPSSVTLTAATEMLLLRLPQAAFSMFVAMYPPALSHLAELSGDVAVPVA